MAPIVVILLVGEKTLFRHIHWKDRRVVVIAGEVLLRVELRPTLEVDVPIHSSLILDTAGGRAPVGLEELLQSHGKVIQIIGLGYLDLIGSGFHKWAETRMETML